MSCILTDPSSSLQNIYAAAREEGAKIAPAMSVFCGDCNQHHFAVTPEDIAVNTAPPAPMPDDFKPIQYQEKSYCRDCASYHKQGQCKSPGRAEELGAKVTKGFDNWDG